MNKEPQVFPEMQLFPRIKAVGSWIADRLAFIPDLGITHGDHFNRGASPMLDAQLDEPDDGFAQGELFGN